jgi:hypothetical protein
MYFFGRTLGSILGVGVALLLVVVVGAWLFDIGSKDLRRRFGGGEPDAGREAKKGRGTQAVPTLPVSADSAWVKTVQLTNEETRSNLAQLEQALVTWNEQVAALLHNEAGRRIAASKQRCEEFTAVTEKHRPTRQDVAVLRARLDEVARHLDDALAGKQRPLSSQALLSQAKQLAQEVRDALRLYRDHLAILDGLVAFSKDQPPAGETLEDAVKQLKLTEATAEAQRLAAARRKAQEQAEEERARQEKEKRKREEAFERAYADMKYYVQPFVTEASSQLDSKGFKPSTVKGPVSWTALQRYLKQDEDVCITLCRVVAGAKDRPRGRFPEYHASHKRIDVETIMKVQQFLSQYGELMVEKGLLAP